MTQKPFSPFWIGKARPKSKFWSRFRKRPIPAGQYHWDRSLRSIALVMVISFLALIGRLGYLQLLHGQEYFDASNRNFHRKINIAAPRGEIRDNYGKILAKNDPSYRLYAAPNLIKPEGLSRLQQYLGMDDAKFAELKKNIEERTGKHRSKEILLLDHLRRDQVALIESDRQHLAGIRIGVHAKRSYFRGPSDPNPEDEGPEGPEKPTEGRMMAHLLGYVNQVGPDEINDEYRPEDVKGRTGIEGAYEDQLRGTRGFEKFTVDASGQRKQSPSSSVFIGEEQKRDPIPGNHVVLTIDARLQRIVYQSIVDGSHPTAASVVDIKTGRILALVSRPAPDWNQRLTKEQAKALESNPLKPMKDRALRETYFPASTFKLVTALSAFQHLKKNGRKFDPYDRVKCNGEFWYLGQRFKCTGSHGHVGLHGALMKSCNVYFYQLAVELGLDSIAETAKQLGLGEETHLYMGEPMGFIPTKDYYEKHGGFLPGFTLNTAIGQGDAKASVLQMAMAYATFANGGDRYAPILVDRIESSNGTVLKKNLPQIQGKVNIPKDVWAFMNQAFMDVVFKRTGTANKAIKAEFNKIPVKLAGKTGTAQLGNGKKKQPNNAWFVGYAPANDPKIAIAVFVEEGGHGGESAAPMAMRIAQKYFDQIDGHPPVPSHPKNLGTP